MKKITTVFLSLIIMLSFCSCDVYEEADMQYSVTCIGFDKKGKEIVATVEMLAIDHRSKDEQSGTVIVTGNGNSPYEAIENINAKLSKKMYLGHCGVIVLGKTLTKKDNKKILLYCNNNGNINSAIYIVTSNSAEELLNVPANAEIAVGYEIMGIISCEKNENGIIYNNRLYQVDYKRLGAMDIFALPNFVADESTCNIAGVTVYCDAERTAELDRDEAFAYHLLTGNVRKGTNFLSDGTAVKTKKATRKMTTSYNDNLEVKIDLSLYYKSSKDPKNEWLSACKTLYEKSKNEYKTDIFGFSDEIKNKDRKLWRKVRKNYDKKYERSNLKINFKAVKK